MTHLRPIHPFPARMAPSIVWDCLAKEKGPIRVLDPMVGSGTTLVGARVHGHHAIGCDTDPLALLIAEVWASDLSPDAVMHRAEVVAERAKALKRNLSSPTAYPHQCDEETRAFIDFWFDHTARMELTALATCIARVRNQVERSALWCGFSRMIITKQAGASLAMDVSHSRPHRVYDKAPISPCEKFEKAVGCVVKHAPFAPASEALPPVELHRADARRLPLNSESVDLIVTSPPYLNAIDYIRGHKLSLVWMGYSVSELRRLRGSNVGSELIARPGKPDFTKDVARQMGEVSKLDSRRYGMVLRYIIDMDAVLSECGRLLRKNGRALFVVGDSTIRGVPISNSIALVHLGKRHGLSLIARRSRPLARSRRYLPAPDSRGAGKDLQRRMKEEVVLTFRQGSNTRVA